MYRVLHDICPPPSTAKLDITSAKTFIFLKTLFQYKFVCKKLDNLVHWLTSGVAFIKGGREERFSKK